MLRHDAKRLGLHLRSDGSVTLQVGTRWQISPSQTGWTCGCWMKIDCPVDFAGVGVAVIFQEPWFWREAWPGVARLLSDSSV